MICNNNYLADILRVCKIKDLIWVMRFQSPLVYFCRYSSPYLFCFHIVSLYMGEVFFQHFVFSN